MAGDDTVLTRARFNRVCMHNRFILDTSLDAVTCGICGEKLNPMWVLENLAIRESRYEIRIRKLQKTEEKTAAKLRCKCEHCGKMTKIYRD